MKAQKVAIQGIEASFHHQAAMDFFENNVEIVPCSDFEEVFHTLKNNEVDYAVVAIENSLYGSINEVYDLLVHDHSWIVGETYLRISQQLLGVQGTSLSSINEVYSHPVAIAQCSDFLRSKLPHVKRFETNDTAASSLDVKTWNDPTKAAIAGRVAADTYGLEIISENIETNHSNYTRFVVMTKNRQTVAGANKTSLILTMESDTKPGALFHALGSFAKHKMNLTMLHSRPVIGKSWHYMFYVDVLCNYDSDEFEKLEYELLNLGCRVTVLGSYCHGMEIG